MRATLTEDFIRRMPRPSVDRVEVWDSRTPGLYVIARPSGRVSYHVAYTDLSGVARRRILGRFGSLSLEDARRAVRVVHGALARGEEPYVPGGVASRRKAAAAAAERAVPTVAVAAEQWLRWLEERRAPTYVRASRGYVDRVIVPTCGGLTIDAVGLPELTAIHAATSAPYAANRGLDAAAALLTFAERQGWRPPGTNPARRVPRHREHVRHEPPTDADLVRLGEALRTYKGNPAAVAAWRVLFLTGARPTEVTSLRAREVDLEASRLRLSASKTGPRDVVLGAAARMELARWLAAHPPATPDSLVFPGRGGRQLSPRGRMWRTVKERAGLPSAMRFYDVVRHGYGARAGGRYPAAIVAALLGHGRLAGATGHYSRPLDAAIQAAADELSAEIAALLDGGAP